MDLEYPSCLMTPTECVVPREGQMLKSVVEDLGWTCVIWTNRSIIKNIKWHTLNPNACCAISSGKNKWIFLDRNNTLCRIIFTENCRRRMEHDQFVVRFFFFFWDPTPVYLPLSHIILEITVVLHYWNSFAKEISLQLENFPPAL